MFKKSNLFFLFLVVICNSCNNDSNNSKEEIGDTIPRKTSTWPIPILDTFYKKIIYIKNQYRLTFNEKISDSLSNLEGFNQKQLENSYKKNIINIFEGLGVKLKDKDFRFVSEYGVIIDLKISDEGLSILRKNPQLENISENFLFKEENDKFKLECDIENEVLPWGIKRVSKDSPKTNGNFHTAWIIDSGIDPTHPDLNVQVSKCTSFVKNSPDIIDRSGHGTHVAGIIGAKRNEIGVVGIAPGAPIVSVKVIDNGIGKIDEYLNGLKYVRNFAKKGDVLNISLQRIGRVEEEERLIRDIAAKGVYIVLSAGNSDFNQSRNPEDVFFARIYPARIDGENVFTISSFDEGDTYSSFSNFGNPIDFSAPGGRILSTLPMSFGCGYGEKSGTSMAAPHISGILLLKGKVTPGPTVFNDPDTKKDKIGTE